MKRHQSGFTLIEIAIVLVIIGLLLGGVLKGQELINSARIKNLAADFKNAPLFIYSYQDKFKALPGDDANADAHLGTLCTTAPITTCVAAAGPTGNGVINGMWDSMTASDESVAFWQHVRLAGLAPGETVINLTTYLPTNAVGGRTGITNGAATNLPITGLRGSHIFCSGGILGKFARQLDITLDDGNTATGAMMVMADAAHPAAVPANAIATTVIDDAAPHTVCMGI